MVDDAHVLPQATVADLKTKLEALQKDTHRQLVVATISDLHGQEIEDYGYKLGRSWGVGLRDLDSGAVLIVAPTEHRVRIEAGRGLEPVLTDAWSSGIIRDAITPRFKAGDLPGGITAGVDAIDAQLRATPEEAQARADAAAKQFDQQHQRRRSSDGGGGAPIGVIFWMLLIGFILLAGARGRRGRGRPWSGGGGSGWPIVLWSVADAMMDQRRGGGRSGGGGGWSGDGGSFGGGGSSGSDGSWGGGGFTGGGGGSFDGGGASGSW